MPSRSLAGKVVPKQELGNQEYLLELLIYPAIYLLWKRRTDLKRQHPGA